MSWGIAETASELEKLKSESADYLNGLNSCGEIDYSTYSHAFDFYAELIEKAYKSGKPYNVDIGDVLGYIDRLDEEHWQEFVACMECRGWNLERKVNKWCGSEFA